MIVESADEADTTTINPSGDRMLRSPSLVQTSKFELQMRNNMDTAQRSIAIIPTWMIVAETAHEAGTTTINPSGDRMPYSTIVWYNHRWFKTRWETA